MTDKISRIFSIPRDRNADSAGSVIFDQDDQTARSPAKQATYRSDTLDASRTEEIFPSVCDYRRVPYPIQLTTYEQKSRINTLVDEIESIIA